MIQVNGKTTVVVLLHVSFISPFTLRWTTSCNYLVLNRVFPSVSQRWKHPFVPLTSSGIKSILMPKTAPGIKKLLDKYELPHHSASFRLSSNFSTQEVWRRRSKTTETASHPYFYIHLKTVLLLIQFTPAAQLQLNKWKWSVCAHLQLQLEATSFKLQEASGNKLNVQLDSRIASVCVHRTIKQTSACSHRQQPVLCNCFSCHCGIFALNFRYIQFHFWQNYLKIPYRKNIHFACMSMCACVRACVYGSWNA